MVLGSWGPVLCPPRAKRAHVAQETQRQELLICWGPLPSGPVSGGNWPPESRHIPPGDTVLRFPDLIILFFQPVL